MRYKVSHKALEQLKRLLEEKSGIHPNCPSEFLKLRDWISHRTHQILGDSTLKRVWGYVNEDVSPRQSTLDILANAAGFECFQSFCEEIMIRYPVESDFITHGEEAIRSEDLPLNSIVELSWMPDRVVKLLHTSAFEYKVIENQNSKMKVGDIVEIGWFRQNQPLHADIIDEKGSRKWYTAGTRNGICFKIYPPVESVLTSEG